MTDDSKEEDVKTGIKWHSYPEEKPENDYSYIAVYIHNGELAATSCFWFKEKFCGSVKDKEVVAWTEMPYEEYGMKAYAQEKKNDCEKTYRPDICPYGNCKKHYVIGVEGRIYDCDVCIQVHDFMEYVKNNDEDNGEDNDEGNDNG